MTIFLYDASLYLKMLRIIVIITIIIIIYFHILYQYIHDNRKNTELNEYPYNNCSMTKIIFCDLLVILFFIISFIYMYIILHKYMYKFIYIVLVETRYT